MFTLDNTAVLTAKTLYEYKVHNEDEENIDAIPMLEQTGLYPKNREKMVKAINSGKPRPDIWLFAGFIDQSDLEFLQDKIYPLLFQELLYFSHFRVDQIKKLISLGYSVGNFNNGKIIRRTYEDIYNLFKSSRIKHVWYAKPKNPTEKKYFEMIKGTFQISHSNWEHYEDFINIIHGYVQTCIFMQVSKID